MYTRASISNLLATTVRRVSYILLAIAACCTTILLYVRTSTTPLKHVFSRRTSGVGSGSCRLPLLEIRGGRRSMRF